ncbi:MAG: ABC transporter permease, partial [Alphaproteobacteria bacterium]|nr:ABC transporter permease [Alphaproteobacteria bacterium]
MRGVATALRRNPGLAVGLALTLLAIAVALLSLYWTPYSPSRIAMARRLQPPS